MLGRKGGAGYVLGFEFRIGSMDRGMFTDVGSAHDCKEGRNCDLDQIQWRTTARPPGDFAIWKPERRRCSWNL